MGNDLNKANGELNTIESKSEDKCLQRSLFPKSGGCAEAEETRETPQFRKLQDVAVLDHGSNKSDGSWLLALDACQSSLSDGRQVDLSHIEAWIAKDVACVTEPIPDQHAETALHKPSSQHEPTLSPSNTSRNNHLSRLRKDLSELDFLIQEELSSHIISFETASQCQKVTEEVTSSKPAKLLLQELTIKLPLQRRHSVESITISPHLSCPRPSVATTAFSAPTTPRSPNGDGSRVSHRYSRRHSVDVVPRSESPNTPRRLSVASLNFSKPARPRSHSTPCTFRSQLPRPSHRVHSAVTLEDLRQTRIPLTPSLAAARESVYVRSRRSSALSTATGSRRSSMASVRGACEIPVELKCLSSIIKGKASGKIDSSEDLFSALEHTAARLSVQLSSSTPRCKNVKLSDAFQRTASGRLVSAAA
mmetsp:Transcript_9994/g.16414  ORF Transcript_9994/g.16414 Transcript_9994/m.16414 type:complete len:420 (+) Transcript_9994:126-1385(+)|eukprot:CAMPEP_0184664506 /NCGR_PEP_ID=MMETSP0308-20130426/53209_1 /TAXON_ID=38269 /ORGANISM="Gloeochaete witrockiana, Strain SAG 46.84" /LENGTH=419 /DNA_ID=CAMNT_0027107959 /DNA_START=58 /DNA_END=1317 /DNA_ORIENTATION=+